MALYDDRLADLSETRRTRRVAQRRPLSSAASPSPLRRPAPISEARRPSMDVQSLLFGRSAGWTESKAKAWAKSHGYRYGKVDITDQYIRIRQFDPKGSKVTRTIPFGRGIRAVVAREEISPMRTATKEAPRRKRRRAAAKKAPKRRRSRKAAATTARRSVRRKRRAKVEAKRTVHRRRRRHVSTVMEAPKKRRAPARRRKARRRVRRASEAWKGDATGHAKAAKKGHRRRKARKAAAPKRRRRRRVRAQETTVQAPRRRRRSHRRKHSQMMETPRRRRRHSRRMRESAGMSGGEFAVALVTAGLGFVLADGVDRFLATYDPSSATPPTDRFTSNGAGTLANTLNVASRPGWMRMAASVALPAVPAFGSMYVKSPMVRSSLEGFALGAGVNAIKLVWNNFLMPMLIGKDTSQGTLQKSYIARLYPAEVAATINRAQNPAATAVSSSGSGALSGAPETGVGGAADVGPFALAGDSPYPDAAQALRAGAGVSGYQSFPSLQNTWGTGASAAGNALPTVQQAMGTGGSAAGNTLPTAAQVLHHQAGMSGAPAASGNPGQPGLSEDWQPGPPALPGAGPQARPHSDPACGCMGDGDQFLGFIGDAVNDEPLYDIPRR